MGEKRRSREMKGGKKKSRVAADFQRSSTKNTQSERERESTVAVSELSMRAFLSTIQSNRLSSRLPPIVFLLARLRDTLSRTTLIETRGIPGGFRDQKVFWHLASYPGGIYAVRRSFVRFPVNVSSPPTAIHTHRYQW